MANFGINELVVRINEIFEEPGMTVTKSEVLQPSTDWVTKMVYGFLKEFGYSEFMNQSEFSCVDFHAGSLSNNIQDTLHLDILVVATRKFFQRIQYNEITFGIMDVVEPEPKRIRRFFCVFVNFWLFCNNQFETLKQRQDEVMDKAKQGKNLVKELNQNLKEVEELQQKRQTTEIQKMKVLDDIQIADAELGDYLKSNHILQENQKANKAEFVELKEMEEELKTNIEKFEKEKKRLEMLVKSDEVKQELETQLTSLKEESDGKMLKVHEWKIKIQEYKTRLVHFQRYHKELHVVTEKNDQIQKARQDIEQLDVEKEEKGQSLLNLDEELVIVHQQLVDVKKEVATRANTWNKKKSCLEAEISDYENEIRKIRQGMSEEEIAASDLESTITDAKQTNERIKGETESEITLIRDNFGKLMNSYKTFNAKMDIELRKVALAFSKLETGKSVLNN